MTTLEEVWPVFGLTVRCGPLELRALRDGDLPEMVDVIQGGIHAPDSMPFLHPWTDATGPTLLKQSAQHLWECRVRTSPERWSLELGVWREGVFVGVQAVNTTDFLVTRTGETGSWLGLPFQGRGTGTLMRQAMCALCFDHLGFTEITSGAFTDNPASRAVSRKVGYVENGRMRLKRREELAVNQLLVLSPESFVRAPVPVEVTGAEAVRRQLGIDDSDPATT